MDFYNVLLAKKTNRILQYGSLYERLFETWINRARQILKDLPTGAISTVTDAAELPLNALKVSVEAWQEGSGTPSPSNIRPIHGWDSGEIDVVGKNWFDKNATDTTNGYVANKYLNSAGTATTPATPSYWSISEYIAVEPDTTYTISGITGNNPSVCEYDAEKNFIDGIAYESRNVVTFTTSATTQYVRLSITTSNIDAFQLELGNQATTYEPYQGKQYTLDFPQTIYGAEWDVVNGEGTALYKVIDIGAADWTKSGNTYYTGWTDRRRTNCKGLCECYQVYDRFVTGVMYAVSFSGDLTTYIYDDRFSTVEEFKTAMQGVKLVYELATPTTIDLSPLSIRLLEGTNNLYADCGEVLSGKYWANV